ncbi:hypothetical protein SRABI112_02631 [Pseudomonas mediterranea]|nr:hypothetical protein SRABI112_02631 [Pseudomonas mediterranea]
MLAIEQIVTGAARNRIVERGGTQQEVIIAATIKVVIAVVGIAEAVVQAAVSVQLDQGGQIAVRARTLASANQQLAVGQHDHVGYSERSAFRAPTDLPLMPEIGVKRAVAVEPDHGRHATRGARQEDFAVVLDDEGVCMDIQGQAALVRKAAIQSTVLVDASQSIPPRDQYLPVFLQRNVDDAGGVNADGRRQVQDPALGERRDQSPRRVEAGDMDLPGGIPSACEKTAVGLYRERRLLA